MHVEWKKGIMIVGIVAGIYVFVRFFSLLWVPFFIAFFFATFFQPSMIWLEKKKLRRGLAAILVIFLFFAFTVSVVLWGGKYIGKQLPYFMGGIPFYLQKLEGLVRTFLLQAGKYFRLRSTFAFTEEDIFSYVEKAVMNVLPSVLTKSSVKITGKIAQIFIFLFTTFFTMYYFTRDYEELVWKLQKGKLSFYAYRLFMRFYEMVKIYIKTQGVICFTNFLIMSTIFYLMGTPSFLLLAFLVAFVDALPVFGCGTILVPWIVLELLEGNGINALWILFAYGCCVLNRNYIEPKMIGKKAGMGTVKTFILMYIGYRLFGVAGFFLGPFCYLAGIQIYKWIEGKSGEKKV